MAEECESAPNEYTMIIVDEAERRSIRVEMIDPSTGEMILHRDGRSIRTIQSLSELTSALGYLNCDDKVRTRGLLAAAGLPIPAGRVATGDQRDLDFVRLHGPIVVKPARGEGGNGVSVGVEERYLEQAVSHARRHCETVLLEQRCEGNDVRVLVIDAQVVAAAQRQPPQVVGDGEHSIAELIAKATVVNQPPVDLQGPETRDHLARQNRRFEDIPSTGESVELRGTANVHAGGSIHDVTQLLGTGLARIALSAAQAVGVPVAGVDLLVPDIAGTECVIIEVNEQPGLANHEPQPTAARFMDLLFPETAS